MRSTENERRAAALKILARFQEAHGIPPETPSEIDAVDEIAFIGAHPDGRVYRIGYLKDSAHG